MNQARSQTGRRNGDEVDEYAVATLCCEVNKNNANKSTPPQCHISNHLHTTYSYLKTD